MKEEILSSIKSSYVELQDLRSKQQKMWEKIKELEQNQMIQEYLILKKEIGKTNPQQKFLTDDEILEISIDANINRNTETNNIYVDLGVVYLDNKQYHRYVNIENRQDNCLIPLDECFRFEQIHKIIPHHENEKYKDIQKKFIKYALQNGQEEAVAKVLVKKK